MRTCGAKTPKFLFAYKLMKYQVFLLWQISIIRGDFMISRSVSIFSKDGRLINVVNHLSDNGLTCLLMHHKHVEKKCSLIQMERFGAIGGHLSIHWEDGSYCLNIPFRNYAAMERWVNKNLSSA